MREWKPLNNIIEVAEATKAGMEIQWSCNDTLWLDWITNFWSSTCKYRARPRKAAKKLVKSLCWRQKDTGNLMWCKEGDTPLCYPVASLYVRFPCGDLEGEVEV